MATYGAMPNKNTHNQWQHIEYIDQTLIYDIVIIYIDHILHIKFNIRVLTSA